MPGYLQVFLNFLLHRISWKQRQTFFEKYILRIICYWLNELQITFHFEECPLPETIAVIDSNPKCCRAISLAQLISALRNFSSVQTFWCLVYTCYWWL